MSWFYFLVGACCAYAIEMVAILIAALLKIKK